MIRKLRNKINSGKQKTNSETSHRSIYSNTNEPTLEEGATLVSQLQDHILASNLTMSSHHSHHSSHRARNSLHSHHSSHHNSHHSSHHSHHSHVSYKQPSPLPRESNAESRRRESEADHSNLNSQDHSTSNRNRHKYRSNDANIAVDEAARRARREKERRVSKKAIAAPPGDTSLDRDAKRELAQRKEKRGIPGVHFPVTTCPKNNPNHMVKEQNTTGRRNRAPRPCDCMRVANFPYYKSLRLDKIWIAQGAPQISLDSFELAQEKVYQGGQGCVYIAKSLQVEGGKCALKLKLRESKSDLTWKMDHREGSLLRRIRHPFTIKLLAVFESHQCMWLVQEYGPKGSLFDLIFLHGAMQEHHAEYYSACMVVALEYLHKLGILFRDMKAENVVLDREGVPKLIDFGMAKFTNDPLTGRTETKYYYAKYIAPEIFSTPSKVDYKADSWGIGYLLVEMLLGQGVYVSVPWTDHTAKNWTFELSTTRRLTSPAKEILMTLMQQDPHKRPRLKHLHHHAFYRHINWEEIFDIQPPIWEEMTEKRRRRKNR